MDGYDNCCIDLASAIGYSEDAKVETNMDHVEDKYLFGWTFYASIVIFIFSCKFFINLLCLMFIIFFCEIKENLGTRNEKALHL